MNGTELKCARIRRKKSTKEMASIIGRSEGAWNHRECGHTVPDLDEAVVISKALDLTEQEFADIFFDGILPYRKK